MNPKPKYPIYIISKGTADCGLTANLFIKDNVDFHLVIEPQEKESYLKYYPENLLYILPFSNLGEGGTPARNWVWEHSKSIGAKRHWIFDDNIRNIKRLYNGKRLRCNANIAIKVIEDFTDRYENIGISGFNYEEFVLNDTPVPYYLNVHVYSALLIKNNMPYKWRLRYNEDTDLCLQVLTNGLCTVLFNAFFIQKMATLTMKGGNMTELYKGDGRLKMARTLEAMWPDWVTVKWRFGRPQHVIKNSWRDFKQPLIRRTDIDWDNLKPNNYGMELIKVKEIKSKSLQEFYEKNKKHN